MDIVGRRLRDRWHLCIVWARSGEPRWLAPRSIVSAHHNKNKCFHCGATRCWTTALHIALGFTHLSLSTWCPKAVPQQLHSQSAARWLCVLSIHAYEASDWRHLLAPCASCGVNSIVPEVPEVAPRHRASEDMLPLCRSRRRNKLWGGPYSLKLLRCVAGKSMVYQYTCQFILGMCCFDFPGTRDQGPHHFGGPDPGPGKSKEQKYPPTNATCIGKPSIYQ